MKGRKKRQISLYSKIISAVFIVSLVVYFFSTRSSSVADYVNKNVSGFIRQVMSYVTYIFGFSVFEVLIILSPLIIVLSVAIAVKRGTSGGKRMKGIFSFISVILTVATLYIYMLGIGYHTTPVSNKMGLSGDKSPELSELYHATLYVRDEVNLLARELTLENVETVMPYTQDELSQKIVDAYGTVSARWSFIENYNTRAKPVYFSTVMSDLRISGIYSFFTGEANVNVEYPDYNLPFTVAHEFAHQRGICRENEANFVAFLVTMSSDDAYIRYSGLLSLYEYLASALNRADREAYLSVYSELSEVAKSDIRASNDVYLAHKDSVLGEWNDKMNDAYLKLNGTEGTVTYSYVVRLAVEFFRSENLI